MFFFWTELRASLQQWQSLNCAIIVIIRQRYQKRKVWDRKQEPKAKTKLPQHTTKHHNQSLTNRGEKVKQAQALTAIYNPRLLPRLQQEIVKPMQCDNYAIAAPSCFRFFFLQQFDTSCWPSTNCNDMTCSSSRTWAYMLTPTGGAGLVDEAATVEAWESLFAIGIENCFSVKMKHNGHCMQPSRHFSALRTDMSWLPWVLLYWPCVKGVQDSLSVASLELKLKLGS